MRAVFAKIAFGVLILVGAPVLYSWRAWLVMTRTSLPQAEAEGWYMAGLVAGALGAIAYYRLHERAEGPMGYVRRARTRRLDPPRAVRRRLARVDTWLGALLLLNVVLLGINDSTRLLSFGFWSAALLVTAGWLVIRWLPWLRGEDAPGDPPGLNGR
jgi:hypothetical protein